MATAAQTAANQANAKHSTGPRTEEGKQRAAANSHQHGFCSQKLIVAPHEAEEFGLLEANLREDLTPAGTLEEAIFQTLLHAHWDQLRIRQHFANFYATQPDLFADPAAVKTYERLRRYAATADRAFNKAFKDLKALQVARVLQFQATEPLDRIMPTLAATVLLKNTKRTQFDDPFCYSEPQDAAQPEQDNPPNAI